MNRDEVAAVVDALSFDKVREYCAHIANPNALDPLMGVAAKLGIPWTEEALRWMHAELAGEFAHEVLGALGDDALRLVSKHANGVLVEPFQTWLRQKTGWDWSLDSAYDLLFSRASHIFLPSMVESGRLPFALALDLAILDPWDIVRDMDETGSFERYVQLLESKYLSLSHKSVAELLKCIVPRGFDLVFGVPVPRLWDAIHQRVVVGEIKSSLSDTQAQGIAEEVFEHAKVGEWTQAYSHEQRLLTKLVVHRAWRKRPLTQEPPHSYGSVVAALQTPATPDSPKEFTVVKPRDPSTEAPRKLVSRWVVETQEQVTGMSEDPGKHRSIIESRANGWTTSDVREMCRRLSSGSDTITKLFAERFPVLPTTAQNLSIFHQTLAQKFEDSVLHELDLPTLYALHAHSGKDREPLAARLADWLNTQTCWPRDEDHVKDRLRVQHPDFVPTAEPPVGDVPLAVLMEFALAEPWTIVRELEDSDDFGAYCTGLAARHPGQGFSVTQLASALAAFVVPHGAAILASVPHANIEALLGLPDLPVRVHNEGLEEVTDKLFVSVGKPSYWSAADRERERLLLKLGLYRQWKKWLSVVVPSVPAPTAVAPPSQPAATPLPVETKPFTPVDFEVFLPPKAKLDPMRIKPFGYALAWRRMQYPNDVTSGLARAFADELVDFVREDVLRAVDGLFRPLLRSSWGAAAISWVAGMCLQGMLVEKSPEVLHRLAWELQQQGAARAFKAPLRALRGVVADYLHARPEVIENYVAAQTEKACV